MNNEIINSLKNNPSYFWYYNNGITAISRKIPKVGTQAESFVVKGLQIINGAQTAYSIYQAYKDSSPEEREIIDDEARVTFRLLKSGGKDFDIKVTKYTNSQNPVSERDFWSSDPIQNRIQNYFYGSNVWYERRAGEFRSIPENVNKVSNSIVASAHLAFNLLRPTDVFESAITRENDGVDLIFTSFKENKDGLYEIIFNKDTSEEDVFVSYCMLSVLVDSEVINEENIYFTNGFHFLAISNVILNKYIKAKFGETVNLAKYIISSYFSQDLDNIKKCISFSSKLMHNEIQLIEDEEASSERFINLMTNKSHFEILIDSMNKTELSVEDIESIELKERNKKDDEDEDEDEDMTIMNNSSIH
ncbi:AIPR family protein [Vibrio fluvialis]|uniref:AIPR family protein n=1 Tax=Vibrio fluvialis TaxID=676 RepID=UPI001EEB2A09|nr:AIPR family protein [Vibrio fluvialis]